MLYVRLAICYRQGLIMKFVTYYRVSTAKQGQSGLGLEAQQQCVDMFISAKDGESIASFTEIESGKHDDRPQLEKALKRCRLTGATLVIAKLDRLSRDPEFIARLQKSEMKFVCCDMPEANNLTVGMMAIMAQWEREAISARTKVALQAAKARGVQLGNPNLHLVANTDTTRANQVRIAKANTRNAEMKTIIEELEAEHGTMSSRELAIALNAAGYRTARGKEFSHTQALRVKAA